MKKIFAIAALFVASVAGTAIAADTAPANSDLKVTAPASVKTGEAVTATISVTTKNGYHINKEYPNKLTLTAVDGVQMDKTAFVSADGVVKGPKGDENVLEFSLPFTVKAAGAKEIKGKIKYAECKATECIPVSQEVVIKVATK